MEKVFSEGLSLLIKLTLFLSKFIATATILRALAIRERKENHIKLKHVVGCSGRLANLQMGAQFI